MGGGFLCRPLRGIPLDSGIPGRKTPLNLSMIRHLPFAIITVFFLVMNYQLYQKDFKQVDAEGAKVPLEMVWGRMLRAPDESFLYMFQDKKRLGSMRWSAEAVELVTESTTNNVQYTTEGMVRNPANYLVDIRSGHLLLGKDYGNVNFDMSANFSTNNEWQTFEFGLHQKPIKFQVLANATNETLRINWIDSERLTEHLFTFDELRDPAAIAGKLFGPLPLAQFTGGLLTGLGGGMAGMSDDPRFNIGALLKVGISIESFQDWLKIGHSRLRCYRITITLPDQRAANVYISRIGEILRVTLPNKIEFRNARLLLL